MAEVVDVEPYRVVIDVSPTCMLMVDAGGAIVLANDALLALFGYRRNELIGMQVDALLPTQLASGHRALREQFLAKPRARLMGEGLELYGRRKDGTDVPIEVGLKPVETPGTTTARFVLCSVVDVTARKRAADQLRLAIEASPAGMLLVQPDGKIVLVNAEVERMFGYRRDAIIGKSVDMLVPDAVRGGHAALRKAYTESPGVRAMGRGRDLAGVRFDGSLVPIEVGLNPVQTEGGSFVLCSIVDITERRRADALRDSLLAEVEKRNSELEAALRDREVLLQEVHHRVKNNLQVITSLLSIQMRRLDPGHARDQLEHASSRIGTISLVHELLHRAKDTATVHVAPYVRALVDNVISANSASEQVAVRVDVDPVALPIEKAIPIGLVVNELVTNAFKYAFANRRGELAISLTSLPDDLLRLVVRDDGPGLPSAVDPQAGSSVGMQIVRSLSNQLRGKLDLERNPGVTWALTFPLV